MELGMVRRMWQLLEPIHATLYYAVEVFEQAAGLGYAVDPRWPSYFAWRAAPLGAAGPELVAATFYSFAPDMARRGPYRALGAESVGRFAGLAASVTMTVVGAGMLPSRSTLGLGRQ